MADTPLTEVVSRQQMDFLNVADDLRRAGTLDPRKPDSWPQHMKDRRQVIDAARKWAELEALAADGGQVIVMKLCEHGFVSAHDGYSSKPLEAGDWGLMAIDPAFRCPGGSRRIVLGEGATDAV